MTKTSEFGRCALVTAFLLAGLTACNKAADNSTGQTAAPVSTAADSDPAAGNLAPVDSSAPASTAPQVAQNDSTNYGNSAPPPDYSSQAAGSDSGYSDYDAQADADSYPADSGYDTSGSQAIEADDPPPPLPEYSQPECPGENYYWTPGYWSYASAGYYWVPGAWVMVPWVNALWTPPYWGYDGSHYRWHGGYWGTHIGFYGGINYGFGYTGRGYYGAYWNNGALNYNRAVTNVNATVVHNVYNYSVTNVANNRISYNGGRGGVTARPTPQEMAVVRDPRTPPVTAQVQYAREASGNRAQFAVAGHAQPAALVAPRPLATSYKAPAAKPPAAAMRIAAARTAPKPAPQGRPNESARPAPEGRAASRPEPNQPPVATRPAPENRPMPDNRQPAPVTRPAPEARPAPQPAAARRPTPENHPAATPAPTRPAPEVRPAPQRPQRPAPEAARPAPQPAARPAPQTAQRPAPESRPAPQAPARPAPQPASHPAPEARPAPPAAHPAPASRPAPPPAARPAPQAHPAPPAAHPAPAPEKKPEEKKEPPKE